MLLTKNSLSGNGKAGVVNTHKTCQIVPSNFSQGSATLESNHFSTIFQGQRPSSQGFEQISHGLVLLCSQISPMDFGINPRNCNIFSTTFSEQRPVAQSLFVSTYFNFLYHWKTVLVPWPPVTPRTGKKTYFYTKRQENWPQGLGSNLEYTRVPT